MKKVVLVFFAFISINVFSQKLYSDSAYKHVAPYLKLSDAIADTGNVEKLILKKKKLTSIPKEVFNMTELEYLDLSKNKIDSIPKEIVNLKNLRVLILAKNKITKIPIELYSLKKLKILDVSSNDISKLPRGIKELSRLEELNLWNTSVDDLPFDIDSIKTLRVIDMRGILLNFEMQEELLELLPKVKLYLSPPCNCSF
ncbi:MAG: hypothetical protein CMD20_00080 [Flavobacteriales bacterium]|nr:hypothetical protein [Flavobacteriales bacterium]